MNSIIRRSRTFCLMTAGMLLAGGAGPRAMAQGGIINNGPGGQTPPSAPEIDPSMVGDGVALLGGLVLVFNSRRKP
jgi:hypothetical protein